MDIVDDERATAAAWLTERMSNRPSEDDYP
jgi:hypothetical protein